MCCYLYAAWSLKQSADEGLSAGQLHKVDGWRRQIHGVAMEETADADLLGPGEVGQQARDVVLVESFGVLLTVRPHRSLSFQRVSVPNNF